MHTTSAQTWDVPDVPCLNCPGLSHITEPVTISGHAFDLKDWVWVYGDDRPITSVDNVKFNDAGEIPAGTKLRLFHFLNISVPPPRYDGGKFPRNQGYFATNIEFTFPDDDTGEARKSCTWTFSLGENEYGHNPPDGTVREFGPVSAYLTGNQNSKGMPLVFPPAHPVLLEITFPETLHGNPGDVLTVSAQVIGYMCSRVNF